MPETPAQPDSKEATEARLCAYLEGDLSPAEVAEVDRHLAGNPVHRQLLADLADHRRWLRAVPRATAPADVGEVYREQAERSMLMGEDERPAGGRGAVWRYAPLAAIVLATVGLATVLAMMLLPARSPVAVNTGPHATPATAPAASPVGDLAAVSPVVAAAAEPGGSTAGLPAINGPAAPVAGRNAVATKGAVKGAVAEAVTNNVADAAAFNSNVNAAPAPAGIAPSQFAMSQAPQAPDGGPLRQLQKALGRTVTLAVTTTDPAAIDGRIRALVGRGRIALADAPSGVMAAAGPRDEQLTERGAAAAAKSAVVPIPPLAADVDAFDGEKDKARERADRRDSLAQASAAARAPLTGAGGGGRVQRRMTPAPPASPAATSPAAPAMAVAAHRYVLTGLSAEQVRQLTVDLSAAAGPAGGVTADGRPVLRRGQTVTVTVAELAGKAGMAAANVVRVSAADGTVAMPMIDPVPAAGATADELAARVADAYRRSDVIPRAKVTVDAGNAGPQTAQKQAQDLYRSDATTGTTVVVEVRVPGR